MFQESLEHFLAQTGVIVRAPRRCGGIFAVGEVVQEALPCPTYMDDLAILLEADSYLALMVRLATVTEDTIRMASDFGLQLNLAAGKTEAVVNWVGAGSRPIRRRLMSLSANRQVAMLLLETCLDDYGGVQFPAVAEGDRAVWIVHLGTLAQAGAGMGREIAAQANTGHAAARALPRRLLGNEGIPQHVRVVVARACIATRCVHQAGTWDERQGPQLQRLKGAWSTPWRIVAGAHQPQPPG